MVNQITPKGSNENASCIRKLPKWWKIIFSIFLINMFSSGSMKVCGIFFEQMNSIEGLDGSLTGLIFVAPSAVSHTIAPIVSVVLQDFSHRQVGTTGGVLVGTSFICSGLFATQWIHFLVFAIFAGIGFGFLFLPSVLSLREEAPDCFASLMPIATMGSYAGIVVLPGIVEVFLSNFGLHAAYCLFGALAWNTISCGLLLCKAVSKENRREEKVKNTPKTEKCEAKIHGKGHALIHGTVNHPESLLHEETKDTGTQNEGSLVAHLHDHTRQSKSAVASQVTVPTQKADTHALQQFTSFLKKIFMTFISSFLDQFRPFVRLEFILFFVAANLRKFSSNAWTLFLIPFLQEMGADKRSAVFLAAVGGIGGGVGRLVAAVSFKVQCTSPINIFTMYYMFNALILFAFGLSGNCAYLAFCTFVSGLLISAKAGMTSGILIEITGPDEFRQAFSLIELGCGVNALLAGFLSGKIYDVSGSFITMFQMCAGMSAVSCVFLFVTSCILRSSR